MTGDELRRARLRLGLTQQRMAEKLGLSRNSLVRYETGRRKITTLLAIAVRCLTTHAR